MKKHEFSLKEAIHQLIDQNGMKQKMMESEVKSKWESIVGKMIADATSSLLFREGILYIQIDSTALKHELNYSKNRIVEEVNAFAGFGLIEQVVIR